MLPSYPIHEDTATIFAIWVTHYNRGRPHARTRVGKTTMTVIEPLPRFVRNAEGEGEGVAVTAAALESMVPSLTLKIKVSSPWRWRRVWT
jgi:hypothetical protein